MGAFAVAHSASAQSFFTSPNQYLTPSYRGNTNTEFSRWDVFYSPYQGTGVMDGVNYPDINAPNGTGQLSSDAGVLAPSNSNPIDPYAFWNTANPTIAQTLQPGAFIIGPGSTGNIYSFSGATGFILRDTTPFTLGTVNLQWQTDGTLIDYSTLRLNYTSGTTTISLAPTNFVTEYQASGSSFGFSLRNRLSAQWNLTGLSLTNYTITWQAVGSSNSFQEALLDTSSSYVEATPSTRAWSGSGANANWSTTANWTGSVIPSTRGNVTFATGSGVTLDSAREISLLTLNAPSGFTLSNSSSAKLKVNTGLTINPTTAATYTISAPLTIGSFNLWDIDTNADVTVSGAVDGVNGFYREGTGTLRLTGAMSFTGQVLVDGGLTYVSAANTYNGATSVFSGKLILKGNAPNASAGTLGNSSGAVSLGSGGSTNGPEAALLIEGAYTVGRGIAVSAGTDPKTIGGQNTLTGATFSGAVTLDAAASGVNLQATGATDTVTFSGAISGGAAALTLSKTGNGTIIFSGTNKTYLNDTAVSAGTLQIATGTALSGNGYVTVASGAKLLVHGSLSGTGTLSLQGGLLGGSGTVSRTFTLDNGDTISPGNGLGTLSTIGETWAGAGRYRFEIGSLTGGAGTGWDLLNITGALSLTASSSSKFVLELDSLTSAGAAGLLAGFNPATNYTWKFASASTSITGFNASAFQVDTSSFTNALTGNFSVSQSGTDLFLNYTPVPEPGTGALLLLGGALGAFRGRRRRVRVTAKMA